MATIEEQAKKIAEERCYCNECSVKAMCGEDYCSKYEGIVEAYKKGADEMLVRSVSYWRSKAAELGVSLYQVELFEKAMKDGSNGTESQG